MAKAKKTAAKTAKTAKVAKVVKKAKVVKAVKAAVKSTKTVKSNKAINKNAKAPKAVKVAKATQTVKATQTAKASKALKSVKSVKSVKVSKSPVVKKQIVKAKITTKNAKIAPKKTAVAKVGNVKAKAIKATTKNKDNNQAATVAAKKTSTTANVSKTEMLKVIPLDDRIVVEVVGKSDRTPGGLYIPESAIEVENNEGIVIAVGRGHTDKKGRLRPMDVKVGCKILFSKFAGSPFQHNGTELLFIREKDVLGVVDTF